MDETHESWWKQLTNSATKDGDIEIRDHRFMMSLLSIWGLIFVSAPSSSNNEIVWLTYIDENAGRFSFYFIYTLLLDTQSSAG